MNTKKSLGERFNSFLPLQTFPSPVYPGLQEHWNLLVISLYPQNPSAEHNRLSSRQGITAKIL